MKGHWWVRKRAQLIPSIKGVLGKEGRMSLCIAALTGLGDMGLSVLYHRSRDWREKYPVLDLEALV